VVADVVFQQLGHEAVDGAARGGEALEGFGTRVVLVQGAQNTLKLPDDFLDAVDQVQFFARVFLCLLDGERPDPSEANYVYAEAQGARSAA